MIFIYGNENISRRKSVTFFGKTVQALNADFQSNEFFVLYTGSTTIIYYYRNAILCFRKDSIFCTLCTVIDPHNTGLFMGVNT